MSLVRVIDVDEHRAEIQVAAARITFALNEEGKAINVLQLPPPNDCFVPKKIFEQARALAKHTIIECRARKAAQAKQPRLF